MLISCQECQANISEAAIACPQCGAPPETFRGAARSCAECSTEFYPAYSACRSCGAPRSVAMSQQPRVTAATSESSLGAGRAPEIPPSNSARHESGMRWVKWVLILVGATLAGRLTIAMSAGDTEAIVGSLVGTLGAGLVLGVAAFAVGWLFAGK